MPSRLSLDSREPTSPANSAPATASACQAEVAEEGAAAARKVPAAPSADRWAPRPKPDPLTAPPAIGWKAARQVQASRRRAATAARNNPNLNQMKDAGAGGAFLVARAARERAAELERLACPIEQAALALRRRGRVVYRMSVHDGDRELWHLQGVGNDVTGEQLVAAAAKLRK